MQETQTAGSACERENEKEDEMLKKGGRDSVSSIAEVEQLVWKSKNTAGICCVSSQGNLFNFVICTYLYLYDPYSLYILNLF
ncbi:hypothetical protein OESDEN_02960 [Oesophagostomum dentatum]|uniref:Uncharacterized protein n=1 Tax=Oesophagostomum dentatum TaxID=61180 RepID=A0A0B1TMM3_OESDE|nr:hypothetical protein OESDEN_02960 [Oesophagostomum dentatum]